MTDIVIPGYSTNDPVPGVRLSVQFAQGPVSGSDVADAVVLLGNKLAIGTAVPDTTVYGADTPVRLATEDDARALFGVGSELFLMWKTFTRVNQTTPVYALAVTESAGAAAAGTLTFATTATKAGTVRIAHLDEYVDVAIANGDTPTVVATAVVTAVNAKTTWAITAGNAAGVVTFTAKQKGPRGNELRFMATLFDTTGITVSPAVDTALTGGATEESHVAALATLDARRLYWIVPAAGSSTVLALIGAQLSTKAAPTVGIRSRFTAATVGTVAAANGIATTVNHERGELYIQPKSAWPASMIAAHMAAVVSKYTAGDSPRTNFSGFAVNDGDGASWLIPASRDATGRLSYSEISSAISNGVSPIDTTDRGVTYLVTRVTTRSLTGGIPDSRIRAAHKVDIADKFAADLETKTKLEHKGKMLKDDPSGVRGVGPNTVTPKLFRPTILSTIAKWEPYLENVDAIKKGIVIQKATSPTNRLLCSVPLDFVENADQFGIRLDQVG